MPSLKQTELTITQYYAPDYELDVRPSNMDNANSREYLDKIRTQVIENLRRTTFAPSVPLMDVPRDSMAMNDEDEAALDDLDEDENVDKRHTKRRFDKYIEKDGELSESDDEEMNETNGVRLQPGTGKRRHRMDFRNLAGDFNDSGMDSNLATPQAASSIPDNDVDEDMNLDDVAATGPEKIQTPSPAGLTNGSAAMSGPQSPIPVAEMDDVTMADLDRHDDSAHANAGAQLSMRQAFTPPDSPPEEHPIVPAPVATSEAGPSTSLAVVKDEMGADDAVVVAQEDGPVDREAQNVEPEPTAEQAAKEEERQFLL